MESDKMKFRKLDNGTILITPIRYHDNRGEFREEYRQGEFTKNGIPLFVQENYSQSVGNVIRGLHYQREPFNQGKLVKCISGRIYDVAVNLATGRWKGVELKSGDMIYIPANMAHGFSVLSKIAHISYKCTEYYSPEHESGILYNDPFLKIDWKVDKPIVSEKDKLLPLWNKRVLTFAENNI